MLDITNYVKAGYSILFIETSEVKRAIKEIKIINNENTNFMVFQWNLLEGLKSKEGLPIEGEKFEQDPINLINHIGNTILETVFLLENFDQIFETGESFGIQQSILNSVNKFKNNQVTLVIIGTNPKLLPDTIKSLTTFIDFPFPEIEVFKNTARELCEQTGIEYNENIVELCKGFSLEEGENALAYSIVENAKLDKNTILKMKRNALKATGFLDYMEPEPLENLGGLDGIKDYVFKRKTAWEKGKEHLPKMRALFIFGVSGTGKSLCAKVISSIFEWPLIIWDISACKDSLVGNTEKNMRLATKTIDAVGKSILMVDEIEKALSGYSSDYDSGVSAGILRHFLTWAQESKGEKVIIATANSVTNLPTELLRAGRFDSIFFVDFPNKEERKTIVEIMNRRYNTNLPTTNTFLQQIENFTGAEIEQLAKDSLFDPWEDAIKTVPLIINTKAKEINKMRDFAKDVRSASKKEIVNNNFVEGKRKITSGNMLDEGLKQKILKKHLKREGE